MWRTHNRRVEVFFRITSFRFSGIKEGNTGKGFGVTGQISSKSEANWVSSSAVQSTECVQSLSSTDWRKICTSMRTSDQKTPRNPSRWELRGPAPPQLGKGENGPHRSHNRVGGARQQFTGVCGWGRQVVPRAGVAH